MPEIRTCQHCGEIFTVRKRGGRVQKFCTRTCFNLARVANREVCARGHSLDDANVYISPTGHRCCRACSREANRRWRSKPGNAVRVLQSSAASKRRYMDRTLARNAVYRAVKAGKLTRPERCNRCGNPSELPIEASHDDYSQPLNVEWLCKQCHTDKDREAA